MHASNSDPGCLKVGWHMVASNIISIFIIFTIIIIIIIIIKIKLKHKLNHQPVNFFEKCLGPSKALHFVWWLFLHRLRGRYARNMLYLIFRKRPFPSWRQSYPARLCAEVVRPKVMPSISKINLHDNHTHHYSSMAYLDISSVLVYLLILLSLSLFLEGRSLFFSTT